MSKYHTPKDYQDAAKSLETSTEELRFLATTEYGFVRIAVAGNPNAEPDTLFNLVPEVIESWDDQTIALNIIQNPKTNLDTLCLLANKLIPLLDNGRGHQLAFKAGVHLCCNQTVPLEVLKALLDPEIISAQFRKVVARETRRKDVLDILISDRSEKVRKHAQKTSNSISEQE